jgi:hypothetical protein
VYVLKRPDVDEFLRKMGEIYEVVVFTASLSLVSCMFRPFEAPNGLLEMVYDGVETRSDGNSAPFSGGSV